MQRNLHPFFCLIRSSSVEDGVQFGIVPVGHATELVVVVLLARQDLLVGNILLDALVLCVIHGPFLLVETLLLREMAEHLIGVALLGCGVGFP